jgi:hypothetical protein
MWNLFHKSNEISVEIQGLDPNPKSIRHSDSKDFNQQLEQNLETVFQSVESGQSKCCCCFGKDFKLTNILLISFVLIQIFNF